jgi:hypothetical protein
LIGLLQLSELYIYTYTTGSKLCISLQLALPYVVFFNIIKIQQVIF